MSQTTYQSVADEIGHEQVGLQQSVIVRAVRDSVRHLCKCLNVLNRKDIFDFAKDKVYELQHPSWSFCALVGVWVNKEQPQYRVDDPYLSDIVTDSNKTSFTIPRLTDGDKIIVRWSFMPRMDSEDFPSMLWEQFADIIRYGALYRLRTYLRVSERGSTPDFYSMWASEIKAARHRLNPVPGPEHTLPWWGGTNDLYLTRGED